MFVKWKNKEYLVIPVNTRQMLSEIKTSLSGKYSDIIYIDVLNDSSMGLVKFEKSATVFLLLSFFIIFLILFIAYKDLLQVLSAILPAVSGLFASFAVSVLTTGKFNLMHITASILLLGISVDYGIFVTYEYKKRSDKIEINATFQSILICALTTLSGFGVLMISSNYSVFSLGSSMSAGIIAAFLTSYFALPFINKIYYHIDNIH